MNAIALKLECSLTDLDWKVIDLGLLEGPRSMNPDGFLARLARDFLGIPVPRGLANARLEALRGFCMRAGYCELIRTEDVRRLKAAGYSTVDLFRIVSHVARYRGFAPSLQEGAI